MKKYYYDLPTGIVKRNSFMGVCIFFSKETQKIIGKQVRNFSLVYGTNSLACHSPREIFIFSHISYILFENFRHSRHFLISNLRVSFQWHAHLADLPPPFSLISSTSPQRGTFLNEKAIEIQFFSCCQIQRTSPLTLCYFNNTGQYLEYLLRSTGFINRGNPFQ